MAASNDAPSLPRAARTGALALLLLVIAGLRHHLVWGESQHLPFSLRPFLDAFETGCLLGFAWLGARAWMHGMRAVAAAPAGARRLVVASLPLLALAIAVPPFLTTDITDYVMRGRILGLHGANPYLQVAADFPQDPFVAFGDSPWKAFPLPYGPIVADVQGAVAWIAHLFSFLPPLGELVVAIVLLKVVFAVCLVGSALLARGVWARVRPGEQDVAFVCLLWNPLLLNEALAQAHNESLVLLPTMLAVGAFERSQQGFDKRDQALDIVVTPDRHWSWKDEEHVEALLELGYFDLGEVERMRAEGQRVIARVEEWGAPFCDGWEKWRPEANAVSRLRRVRLSDLNAF
jgi:hypothetical protein